MGLDIRLPIGLMFAILGALLAVYGLVSDPALYARSLGINVNEGWGIVCFLFGAVMFFLVRRGTSAMRSAQKDEEGRMIDEPEKESSERRPPAH